MKKNRHQSIFALLAAIIWGAAFSAQSVCAQYLGPLTITALRSLIAFLVLFAVCLLRRKSDRGTRRDIIIGSIVCGTALFAASNMQQLALNMGASAGKAGFITALYIVLVPIGQVFFKQKISPRHWLAVAVAVVGMYFLCITDGFSISPSDLYLLLCAFLFAVQILAVDRFSARVDGLVLSCGMFLVVAVLSSLFALPLETITLGNIAACIWPLLYIAVFSSCLGYTFQILAQKGGNPAVVSLLMSLESLFAAVFGALLLGERMSTHELIGCALMIAAIVVAELPAKRDKAKS